MRNKKNNRTLAGLLFSYISIFMIPVLVAIITVSVLSSTLIREINNSNIKTMQSVQESFDNFLANVHSISMQIDLNEKHSLVYGKNNEPDPGKLYDDLQTLKLFVVSNTYIDGIYVYNSDYDLVLSDQGTYNKEYFYDIKYGGTELTKEEWLSKMESPQKAQFIITQVKKGEQNISDSLEYVVLLSVGTNNNKYATLVIQINKKAYFSIINKLFKNRESEPFIIDEDNNIITSGTGYEPDVKYSDLSELSGNKKMDTSDGEYVFSYTTSKQSGWKYVIAIKEYVYFKETSLPLALTVFVGFILCLIIGVLTIRYFVKTNYIKINNMHLSIKQSENERIKLKDSLSDIVHKNKMLNESIENKNAMLKERYAVQLLCGMSEVDKNNSEYFQEFDDGTECVYMVIVCTADEYDSIFEADVLSDEERKDTAFFVVNNVMTELIANSFECYSVYLADELAILVKIPNGEKDKADIILEKSAEDLIYFIDTQFAFEVVVGIGEIVKDVNDIKNSYKTAKDALDYRIVSNDYIFNHNKLSKRKSNYVYSIETQKILINAIMMSDKGKVRKTIDEIFNDNFSKGNPSIRTIKYLIIDVVNTINKVADKLYDVEVELFSGDDVVERIFAMGKIEDMKEFIKEYASKACDYQQKDKRQGNELALRIKEYADENYFDKDINIASIADKLGYSYQFISRTFKEYQGETLLDYIHKKKIEHVKRLLNEDVGLTEICREVGYVNSNVLIRVFKKYEGITPGQYKKQG